MVDIFNLEDEAFELTPKGAADKGFPVKAEAVPTRVVHEKIAKNNSIVSVDRTTTGISMIA